MRFFLRSIPVCAAIVVFGACCEAMESKAKTLSGSPAESPACQPDHACGSVVVYQDGRITLHTDLPPAAARATLAEMQRALRFAEKHWRRPLRGTLECYVAADASRWPDKTFPHPLARVWIDCIGGATVSEKLPASRCGRSKATLYASTRRGAAAHEIVHAYCSQTFGHSGPDWYHEGVAMVVGYHGGEGRGVQCPLEVLATLRQGSPQTVRQLIRPSRFTSSTRESLARMVAGREKGEGQVPTGCWTSADSENLAVMCKAYDRSWSLCYLLLHDPNYQSRFRRLGSAYLTGHRPSFQQAFGAVQEQLAFDYSAFMQHVDMGYRADLCSWEWGKTFHELERSGSRGRAVQAARGYQATGVVVARGQCYDYEARGNWSTSADVRATDANGRVDGVGRLEGVVMRDYQLSEPFELGTSGSFSPSISGRLYVRCHDRWNRLADNRGALRVAFSRGSGKSGTDQQPE